jgi:hypothetical protein
MEPPPLPPEERRPGTPPLTSRTVENMAHEIQVLRRAGSFGPEVERKSNVNWALFKDDRVLSDFDPSKSTQTVDEWLRKINDCAHLYGWDEVTTKMNFAELFRDAATYEAEFGQKLNEYCFRKLAKLNKLQLNLSEEQIVDCIIAGIPDKQIQLALRAAHCPTFVELTKYAANFPSPTSVPQTSNTLTNTSRAASQRRGEKRNFYGAKGDTDGKRVRDSLQIKCFTCGEPGHKRSDCPTRGREDFARHVSCGYCHKSGHIEDACRKKNRRFAESKTVNFVGTGARPTIYHKLARINNHVVTCFVDLGSETSLLRKSVADKLGVQQQKLDHASYIKKTYTLSYN